MPNHNHSMMAVNNPGNVRLPSSEVTLARSSGGTAYQQNTTASLVAMADQTLPSTGGGQAHTNLQPFLAMNFIIALVGLYPSRS